MSLNGLALDVFAFAVLFLLGSLTFLWLGALWDLKDARKPTPPPVDRLLWDSEAWEDPRQALALEACKSRHPSNRNRQEPPQ